VANPTPTRNRQAAAAGGSAGMQPARLSDRPPPDVPTSPVGYLDVAASVRYTSMSRRTLDYAKDRGELPYVRKGRKVLFRLDDLARWMDAGRVDVTAEIALMDVAAASAPGACRTRTDRRPSGGEQ